MTRASRALCAAGAAALLAGAGCRAGVDRETVRTVDAPAAAALLRRGAAAFILDVSPPDDFAAAHIPGAVNIPRSQLWFRMYDVPADQSLPILVYDTRGERAASAARQVGDEGYSRVYALRGGLEAWRAAGLPVEP